jgi:hypothetical protein
MHQEYEQRSVRRIHRRLRLWSRKKDMRGPRRISESIDAQLERLDREHLVEIRLGDLEGLMREPDLAPFAPTVGPRRAGIEDVALTLAAAKIQPDDLTVRVVLPSGAPAPAAAVVDEARAAMRQASEDAASAAWREAVSVRNMGLRQLPFGMTIALFAAIAAYAFAFLGGSVDTLAVQVLCFALGGVAITIAWVVSWMVVEATMLDWREPARQANAYDLLSRATLEVVSSSA